MKIGKNNKQAHSNKSVSRREFIATGVAATLGYSLLGLVPLSGAARGQGSEIPKLRSRRSLASSVKLLKNNYDVLVVGSGYGGSILSARLLAQQGISLCLLERGKEWHPGEFPTGIADLNNTLRSPVNPLGLVDITAQMGADIDVISGSGLGGTSLINAAIAIRPEKLVFEQKDWPDEIRDLAEQSTEEEGPLWDYYNRVERILKPTTDMKSDDTLKVQRFKSALLAMRYPSENLRLNINHTNGGELNEFGVVQGSCVRCGDCCSGCNAGAKNTLAMNYLPMAQNRGAQIFTGMEVTKIKKNADGYLVSYAYHGQEGAPKQGTIQTKVLILSAGSLGTSEILLRSKHESNLSLSAKLGTRVSANGDVLSFSYNGDFPTNIVDYGNSSHPRLEQSFRAGQAIVSASKYRGNSDDLTDHFLLLDGPVPSAFAELLARTLATMAAPKLLFHPEKGLRATKDLASIHPPDDGALNHSLVMLACGHDSSGGKYVYNGDGKPKAVWPNVTKEASFNKIRSEMKKVSDKLGGLFIPNPRSELFGGHKLQATHPLGGCPMGNTVDAGVVNHLGQVFDADGNLHRGLFVADASIIPRSLGATPLMTISALSERIADSILSQLPQLL